MLFLGLQARRPAQPFPDADDVVVARAEPFVGVVIGVACLVQRRADPFERTGEGHQLFVEFQPACGDVPGVLVLVVVFPQVGDQFEQGEKIRRRRDDDLLVVGVRPDGRVVLQCGEEGRLVGDEHDDEVGRVEQALVLLASQFIDVLADGGRVGSEVAAALLFGFGRGVAYESRERNFRVDDDVFLLGQVQHDVGAQVVSLGVLDVVLRFVVDALDERRTVQDRFQQHFAPVALHFRIAFQCVRQVRGLGRDAPVEFHQVFQLGLQFAALCRLGGVDVLDALSEFGDVVAEGFEQHVERFFVGLLEMFGLLAQYLGCKVAELGPEGLLQFFALGFFGRAILGVLRAQRCDLGLG